MPPIIAERSDGQRLRNLPVTRIHISAYTLSCAAGVGLDALRASIGGGNSGLAQSEFPGCDLSTWFGRVETLENADPLPQQWESRNNQLARLGITQDGMAECIARAIARWGAPRVGLIIGTSTSSIGRTETAYRSLDQGMRFPPEFRQAEVHNPHSSTAFLAEYLDIDGPCMTVSTACSSSAKAFASAARWLGSGCVDAVLVGGVDSLCLSVIYGFHSLQLVSEQVCRPFDTERTGINLGEAAGFALLEREPEHDSSLALLGYGESVDAYHMSNAHPDGHGARLAMQEAVDRSGLSITDIDYVNLHGTGTRANDRVEAKVCDEFLDKNTRISATKGWTGHTLGAAGITEAVFCLEALTNGLLPGTLNTTRPLETAKTSLLLSNRRQKIRTAMSNSFGFGGNNCSLLFGMDD